MATHHAVLVSHGTSDLAGRAVVSSIVADARRRRAGLQLHLAHVDVQAPFVGDVTAELLPDLRAGATVIVVPLLLSVGYHVRVDVARAVAACPALSPAGGAAAAGPLGPDPRLADLLCRRLRAAGVGDGWSIVLAAAGSSDPDAALAAAQTAVHVRQLVAENCSVTIGYGASAKPSVTEAVAMARARRPRAPVAVASYLLAPGFFHDQLARCGADVVSAPLGPDPILAEIALDRYDEVARAHRLRGT